MLRIAAFGFRYIPPYSGSAGSDRFAEELYSRFVQKGHEVTAYNRVYGEVKQKTGIYRGIKTISIKTIYKSGFDTLFHSLKTTIHIIRYNTGEIVHIHNGGNSIFALILRLFGKKVVISQDGVDWKREKWSWYAKVYLFISTFITAFAPNEVVFDNVFTKQDFEKKFNRNFKYIPYGCEVISEGNTSKILEKLELEFREYFLFIGRFIPDKGLHYLIPAFEKIHTNKKLVIVGGPPHKSAYYDSIRKTSDKRIIFPGYLYGDDANWLIKNAYCYIQPSDVEGLSPIILQVMGLGTPIICSDIKENSFIVKDYSIKFVKSNVEDVRSKINYSLSHFTEMELLADKAKEYVLKEFSWDMVQNQYINLFFNILGKKHK